MIATGTRAAAQSSIAAGTRAAATSSSARSIGPGAAATQDQHRLASVLSERRTRSEEFFSSTAGQWDRLRDEQAGLDEILLELPISAYGGG
jgi:hypothetical protein